MTSFGLSSVLVSVCVRESVGSCLSYVCINFMPFLCVFACIWVDTCICLCVCVGGRGEGGVVKVRRGERVLARERGR